MEILGVVGHAENTLDNATRIQAFFLETIDDGNTPFFASRAATGGAISDTTTLNLNEGDEITLAWLWANGGRASRSYLIIRLPDSTAVHEGDMSACFVRACNDGRL
ncbi:hypothetical protein PG993_000855 [Apiospora rasikravindrae]|uniref:Uncharacterized protein n=1 Tax=Apiospora rasikravindrae TaxID=990691 RepID=A0ABR1U9Q5_9PEZI